MWPFRRRRQKPQPTVKTPLGIFRFCEIGWMTDPPGDEPVITFWHEQLDSAVLDQAQSVLNDLDRVKAHAKAYAVSQDNDLVSADDQLVLEGIDLTELAQGAFALEFRIANQTEIPDLVVTVDIKDGQPVVAWGGD